MKIKKVLAIFFTALFCMMVTGCFPVDNIMSKVRNNAIKNKVVCEINAENATQISYNGTNYQISNVLLERSKIGGWNGIINKITTLDKNYCIIEEKEIDLDIVLMTKNIKENLPKDAKFIVPFQNVCLIENIDDKEGIAVQINNNFYKAIPVVIGSTDKTAIKYEEEDIYE
ncbi:NisI/SpaI family lantibiotic immunity lipoprotein [Clostridium gasigenes]|uniref:NisI/SpaI family lantibiotic immunity lipoprotein n=1 Tax=Clostridium gasigenes TaxID=94869 RepID=UPI001A921352|nr:NisI/SpaI family lantibiotic immunity lipoprotein [Clostridium gasigenes]QSW20014.1 NisI/SpaI family lantibiotic immunity lipoprotein [Clostridium gasigenes]